MEMMDPYQDQNVVVTGIAREGMFSHEFESNGKLEASRKASISYEVNEEILSVEVKNGERVTQSRVLSRLDDTQLRHNYERTVRALEKSRLNLKDVLITLGWALEDSLNIPQQVMKVAMLRSGYRDAISEHEMASRQLKETIVRAPFAGVVADVKAKPYNKSEVYNPFCTLIDDSRFDIVFPLLESEAFKLSPGLEVAVVPYALDGDTLPGRLTEINPRVDEKTGMVQAKATIKNKTGRLADGMNVKVIVRKEVGRRVIVPKSAVTLRQERKVVFVCKNDTAHWRYVNVGEENSNSCAILNGDIQAGEEVVVDGNFNLAHLVPVVRMNP
jgi:membrane fusion protein (multidrug efflux system)